MHPEPIGTLLCPLELYFYRCPVQFLHAPSVHREPEPKEKGKI